MIRKWIGTACWLLCSLLSIPAHSTTSSTWPAANAWGGVPYARSGDFNGDGLSDLISAASPNAYLKLSTGTGFISTSWPAGSNWSPGGYTVVGDFNGDKKDDIASAVNGIVYVKLNESTGSYHFNEQAWSVANAWGGSGYTFAGDFNGDGKADIASANAGVVYMKLSTGSGFVSQTWSVANSWGGAQWTFAADFNGDGKTDIASANAGVVYMKLSTGTGFISTTWAISNLWGGSGYGVAGDFNGDGLADIASPNSGSIILKLNTGSGFTTQTVAATNQWGGPGWSFAGDYNGDGLADIASPNADSVYMKLSDPPIAADSQITDSRYYVRSGDLNGDGLRDLMVTGGAGRAVGDFILVQIASQKFTLIAYPSASQLQIASQWPVTNIAVYREDMNFDGYFDFNIENIDEVIPGAPSLIIFTTRHVGSAPVKVVHKDTRFKETFQQINKYMTNAQSVWAAFNTPTCFTTYVPVIYPGALSMTGGLWYENYWDWTYNPYAYPYVTFVPQQYCVNSTRFNADATRFLQSYGAVLTSNLACASCAEQAATNAGYVRTASSALTALWIMRAATAATAILIADDATLVGLLDDVLVPITASVAIGAYWVYIVNNNNSADVGPNLDGISTPGTPDPSQMPPGCRPNDHPDYNTQILAGGRMGDSRRLGNNLKKVGCPKPDGDWHAHHIAQKNPETQAGRNVLELLKRNHIDVDEAINGIWLPKGQNVLTRARAHLGGGMHSLEYDQAVYSRLANAENLGGQSAVRAELELIGKELSTNTFVF